MSGPLNFISLNAATATGPGGYPQLNVVRSIHTMQVTFTGSPTAVVVALEGTSDATVASPAWKEFGRFDTGAGNLSGDFVTISEQPLMAIRAHLLTLTAGTNPTVTANCSMDSYN